MKFIFTFGIILFSAIVSAKTSETSIVSVVLNDSVVSKYITDYGGIQTDSYVLSGEAGYFLYTKGTVEFQEQFFGVAPPVSGIITKLKNRQKKASVKICFNEKNTCYTKIKLERPCINETWRIKTRLIYGPKKQHRLFYFSYN